jgi:hypothetical protein
MVAELILMSTLCFVPQSFLQTSPNSMAILAAYIYLSLIPVDVLFHMMRAKITHAGGN